MSIAETHPYWVDIEDLEELFPNYTNRESLYYAIRAGNFPVPTFKVGRKIYADKEVVRAYFIRLRAEAKRAQEAAS